MVTIWASILSVRYTIEWTCSAVVSITLGSVKVDTYNMVSNILEVNGWAYKILDIDTLEKEQDGMIASGSVEIIGVSIYNSNE